MSIFKRAFLDTNKMSFREEVLNYCCAYWWGQTKRYAWFLVISTTSMNVLHVNTSLLTSQVSPLKLSSFTPVILSETKNFETTQGGLWAITHNAFFAVV